MFLNVKSYFSIFKMHIILKVFKIYLYFLSLIDLPECHDLKSFQMKSFLITLHRPS